MILVIGGANMDIIGFLDNKHLRGDSTPGKIVQKPGGVGRNMAQALGQSLTSKDREEVELITILSDDENSLLIKKKTEKTGVSLKHSLIVPGMTCPSYMAIMDEGDMVMAVNDMALLNLLTPDRLKASAELIRKASAVILDANLPEETIEWLTKNFSQVPFIAETVSTVKCVRFQNSLDKLYCIKPNKIEAEKLTGMTINGPEEALQAAQLLLKRGVKQVLITLASQGSVYASRQEKGHIPPVEIKREEIDVNGAGDYYLAGVILSLLREETLSQAARAGTLLAAEKLEGRIGE